MFPKVSFLSFHMESYQGLNQKKKKTTTTRLVKGQCLLFLLTNDLLGPLSAGELSLKVLLARQDNLLVQGNWTGLLFSPGEKTGERDPGNKVILLQSSSCKQHAHLLSLKL